MSHNPEIHSSRETLGGFIERKLEVPGASLVLPQHLAFIGVGVWADDELSPQSRFSLSKARQATSLLSCELGVELSPDRYLELIGENPGQGEIARAIKRAKEELPEPDYHLLRKSFAYALGKLLTRQHRHPTDPPLIEIGEPGIRYEGQTLFLAGIPYTMPRRPDIVIEYGPGLVFAQKIPSEVSTTLCILAIEGGDPDRAFYKIEVLSSFAGRLGVIDPQLILRMDGIKSAMEELLANPRNQGTADLVIASAIGVAGEEEIEAGIKAAHTVLCHQGVLAIKGKESNQPDHVGVSQMIKMA